MIRLSTACLYWVLIYLCWLLVDVKLVLGEHDKPVTVQGLKCYITYQKEEDSRPGAAIVTKDEPDEVKTSECCKGVGSCHKFHLKGDLLYTCFFPVSKSKTKKFKKCCNVKTKQFKYHSVEFTKTFSHERVAKKQMGEPCD